MKKETQKDSLIKSDDIDLKELVLKFIELIKYFYSYSKIIIISAVIGAIVGAAYSFFTSPTYTASLTFALEDSKSSGGFGSALGLASTFGLEVGGGGVFEGSNLTELFKSRTMVENTLLSGVEFDGREISLAEMYIETHDWRSDWKNESFKVKSVYYGLNENRKSFSRTKDSILGEIYNELLETSLEVNEDSKKNAIISVNLNSENEIFAKLFTEELVNKVSEFYAASKSKRARDNMNILQKQTDSVRLELNKAINDLGKASDNIFGLNPALNVKRSRSLSKQVDVQANTVLLTELVKQRELANVAVRKETPLIQVIDYPILPLEKNEFGIVKGVFLGFFLGFLAIISFLVVKRLLNLIME